MPGLALPQQSGRRRSRQGWPRSPLQLLLLLLLLLLGMQVAEAARPWGWQTRRHRWGHPWAHQKSPTGERLSRRPPVGQPPQAPQRHPPCRTLCMAGRGTEGLLRPLLLPLSAAGAGSTHISRPFTCPRRLRRLQPRPSRLAVTRRRRLRGRRSAALRVVTVAAGQPWRRRLRGLRRSAIRLTACPPQLWWRPAGIPSTAQQQQQQRPLPRSPQLPCQPLAGATLSAGRLRQRERVVGAPAEAVVSLRQQPPGWRRPDQHPLPCRPHRLQTSLGLALLFPFVAETGVEQNGVEFKLLDQLEPGWTMARQVLDLASCDRMNLKTQTKTRVVLRAYHLGPK